MHVFEGSYLKKNQLLEELEIQITSCIGNV